MNSQNFKIFSFPVQSQIISIDVYQSTKIEITDKAVSDILTPIDVVYHLRVYQQAQLEMCVVVTQLQYCSIHFVIELIGFQSSSILTLLYTLTDIQKLKVKTEQKHYGAQTTSSVTIRGVTDGTSAMQYDGLIHIAQNTPKAYGLQEHKNIALSRRSSVISIPSIEVLHHDVQCFHGAAMSKFQPEHVRYLQSRLIKPEQACVILLQSFFGLHVQRFSNPENILESLCKKKI